MPRPESAHRDRGRTPGSLRSTPRARPSSRPTPDSRSSRAVRTRGRGLRKATSQRRTTSENLIVGRCAGAARENQRAGSSSSARIIAYPSNTSLRARVTTVRPRSEEHTSELQSHSDLVCRLLLEKKKKTASSLPHTNNANHLL